MQYSVVNYKTVKDGEGALRLDPEHYRKAYLDIKEKLESREFNYLSDILAKPITTGHTPSMSNDSYYGGNIAFVKTDNVREHAITDNFNHYLTDEGNKKINRSQLKIDDVLLTIIGASFDVVGRSVLVTEEILPANINQNIALIRVDDKKFNPKVLAVYLNSFYGRNYLYFLSRQTEQVNLNNNEVGRLIIPTFSKLFIDLISKIVDRSYRLKQDSKSLYSQAEQLLLSELGLTDWKPKHELAFVKNFSDTQEAERFDAEYFQPKYEGIVEAVKKYKPARAQSAGGGGFDELGELVKMKKCIEPGSNAYQENGVPFVRVSNLSKFEISTNNQQFISHELYEELKAHQPKKDEILLSKDATPGIAYHLKNEPKQMIPSGGILRLKIKDKKVLPEYLTLVLNSVIVQKQIERDAGGSIINHWRPDQVKATIIPILKDDKQKEIKKLIEKSFCDRELSKSLLEIAKHGVEMAIEKDENEAEKWINGEIEKFDISI